MTPDETTLLDRFCAWKEHNAGAAAGTVRKYRRHVVLAFAHLRAKDVVPLEATADDLELYVGPELHKTGQSGNSRRVAVAALRTFFSYAAAHRVIPSNPAASLSWPRQARSLPHAMPEYYAEAMMWAPDLETFVGVRDAAILGVFVGCGIRRSGLLAMNEEDLLFSRGEQGEELVIRVREKGNHERLVPVPDVVRLMIRAYLGHRELATIDRRTEKGLRVLFVSTANRMVPPHKYVGEARRLSDGAINDLVIRYAERAGVPREFAHPHSLRHLYGKELAEDDIDLLVRQRLMGHRDVKSTEIYSHIADRKLRKAIDQANPFRRIRSPFSDLSDRARG